MDRLPDKASNKSKRAEEIRFGNVSPVAHLNPTPVVQFAFKTSSPTLKTSLDIPKTAALDNSDNSSLTTSLIPTPVATPSPSNKSWSGLFSGTSTINSSPAKMSVMSSSSPAKIRSTSELTQSLEKLKLQAEVGNDCLSMNLPEINLTWRSLQTILQTLVHCQALGSMFEKLQERLELIDRRKAPFLRALSDLFIQHEPLDKDVITSEDGTFGKGPLVPESLYECLRIHSHRQSFQGAQEDAQEFLTFLLDQLHEELLANDAILKCKLSHTNDLDSTNRDSDISGEWFEVGKNQKVAIARTMEHTESAISSLFFGRFRSLVRRPRAKDSVTTEPFHCIGLEILDDGVKSLEDALAFMTKPELIDAKITKTLRVEIAPPILVLQFKRFVYTQSSGIEKLNKFISYPEKLTLDVEGRESTTYRLFSVIYHHGRSANGGHYTCHVRHGQVWVSYDDATMMIEPLERVLMEKATWQTAYLLFYVRNSTRRR